MNSVNLQDIKLIHRNVLHVYTLIMNDQKDKLRKQSHLPQHQKKQNKMKQNKKTPRNNTT